MAALTLMVAPLGAQTAHFSYAQSTIANSLNSPTGAAVDSEGNIYVAEPASGDVVKETLSNGSYTQSAFLTGLDYPSGIAIDSSGNVYVSCLGNSSGDTGLGSVVKTTLAAGGSLQSTILTGLNDPTGIAVDSSGNLYIAERSQNQSAGSGDVIKETLSGGSYTPSTIVSGLDYPTALAVDGSGNIYIAVQGSGSNSGSVLEEIWSAGTSSYTETTIAGGSTGITLNDTSAVAMDASGNVYFSDAGDVSRSPQILVGTPVPGGGFTQSLAVVLSSASNPQGMAVDKNGNFYISGSAQVLKVQTRGVDFGSTDIAATTPLSETLTFAFDTGGAIGATTVLTQGAAGLDFADADTGTCTTSGSYSAEDTCTVNVNFTPKYAGLRKGAVVLKDTNGNTIATTYLHGAGTGPQVTFNPGVKSTLGGLTGAAGITVDAAGNVYVAASSTLVKLPWDGSSYGTATTLASGLNSPESLAVDGAGNIFIGEGGQLSELPWTGSSYGTLTQVASGEAQAVAVDGNGNLYYGGGPTSPIYKLPWNGSGYGSSTSLGSGSYPQGVAVDAGGNVFIAFSGSNEVVKVPWNGSTYGSQVVIADASSTGLSNPQNLALDGNGDVYIADTYDTRVVKVPWNGSSYGAASVLAGVTGLPVGVALDRSGNIYVAAGSVYKFDVATPPTVTFATTALGSTSSDSPQTITLANIGNAELTFPVPATGNNPSIASNFSLNNATTCPELDASSSAGTLAAGASCALAIAFEPTATGSITGSLVLKDDNLNAAAPNYTTQSIILSGAGQKASQTITFNNPGAQDFGSSPTLTATATSGLTVTFTSSTTAICTVTSGGTLTFVATGTCAINADQAGNSTYEAATTVSQSFAVVPTTNLVVTTAGDGTSPALNMSGPFQSYNGTGEIDGFQFTATKTETVSALGIFAGPGLTLPTGPSFAVGLWKSDGTLLASASVTSADTAIGSFYYHSITPVTLTAGQTYVVGAQMGSGLLTYFGGSYSMADGIQYVGNRWDTSGSLTMPTSYDGSINDPGYIGANFLVGTGGSGGDASDCTPQTTPGAGTDAVCSLRDALLAAATAGAANISFDSTVFATSKTITLASGLTIPSNTTIQGPTSGSGAAMKNLVTVSGNNTASVFTVNTGAVNVSIANLIITDGSSSTGGGGVYNQGDLTINNSTISGNSTSNGGGGILNTGTLAVNNSAITNNTVPANGGGLYNTGAAILTNTTFFGDTAIANGGAVFVSGGTLIVKQSTISGNSAVVAGGVFVNAGTATYANSIVAGNTASDSNADIYGSYTDDGGNVASNSSSATSTITPELVTLGNYGGLTRTMLPLPGSPAICTGTVANATGIAADQRGLPRTTTYSGTDCVDAGAAQTNYSLSFTQQPGDGAAAGTIAPSPTIQLNESGNPIALSGVFISMSTAAGTLSGTTTESTGSNGQAIFSDLSIGTPQTSDTLTTSVTLAAGSPSTTASATSSAFNLTSTAPTITFTVSDHTYGDAAFSVSASSDSAGAITYSVVSGPATVSGSKVTLTGAGTVKLEASQVAAGKFSAATQDATFSVAKGTPTINWSAPASIPYGTTLSSAQLNASSPVAGSFAYSPAAGTVLGSGTQTLSVTFTPTDTASYTTATATANLTVNKAAPSIIWNAPSAITYGTALSSAQLNASSPVAGSFAYSPAAGTVLGSGTQTLSVTFTPTDTTDYTTATATVTVSVQTAALTVTANNATKIYGTANPAFSGSVTGAASGDAFTESFTTAATANSSVGTYAIVPSVTGANLAKYAVTVANGTLTVTKAGSAVALVSSVTDADMNANVTFTATVTSTTTGTPSGTVEFLDGSTVLGSATLNSTGVATYSTAALAVGAYTVNAVYAGGQNFSGSTAALAQQVTAPDYSLAADASSLTLRAGQTGNMTFTFTPVGGFTGTVHFTCSGLPANASCSFAPLSLTADGSNKQQISQLTITTEGPNTGIVASNQSDGSQSGSVLAGILWLPGLLFGCFLLRDRKKLGVLIVVAAISGMIGCAFGPPQAPPGASTVTVTAVATGTADGATSHSAAFTLNITQ